jgi:omega-6 fatty acid desaturase (delta-12 desaturase)
MSPYDFTASAVPEDKEEICVKAIAAHCDEYKGGHAPRSIFQLVMTMALFVANLAAMHYAMGVSYALVLLLAVPAAGLLTRIFIFQHDCGHQSFFKTKKVNDWVGRCLGVLTFTPYDFWRRAHNMHHATSGDLDRRSIGGIDTVTVKEYQALPKSKQLMYRIYRNPLFLLCFGTPFYVIVAQRLPFNASFDFYDNYKTLSTDSIRGSIMENNLAILIFYGALALLLGPAFVFAVYMPVVILTSIIGGWLFYIQHQFEDTYWEHNDDWNLQEAALLGSSYYELPKFFQWFTGNIGLHHIHHLNAKIPNYKLQECMDDRPELATINRMTFRESLQCLDLKIWDEDKKELVSLKAV